MGFKANTEDDGEKDNIFRSILITAIQVKTATIKSVAICLKAIYVVTSDKQVLRWNINEEEVIKTPRRDQMTELIIRGSPTSQQSPEQVFCDKTGWHCIVTFNTEICHYFHYSAVKSLLLNKLAQAQQQITSVAWHRLAEKFNSREVLLGTSKGLIIELTIEYEPASETIKHNFQILFNISNGIFGLEYLIFPGNPGKVSVIAACPTQLYQFIGDTNEFGRPVFADVFKRYKDSQHRLQRSIHEFPGTIKRSQLQIYNVNSRPDTFAWMNSVGMFFGSLPKSAYDEIYVGLMKPIQRPKRIETLVGIGMTSYHLYFLGTFNLVIVSKISQQVVHTIDFEKRSGYEMVGMVFDERSHSFFAWSHKFIYQIVIEQEDRDVWKYYIDQHLFDDAIKFCESTGSKALFKVKGMYGDFLYTQGKTVEAAEAYALSEYSFEETALKLRSDNAALQKYLETRLKLCPSDMNTQKTLLSTWLVEIYIENINCFYLDNEDSAAKAEEKLQRFLDEHQEDLDEETTCYLLQTHGRIDDWVTFADLRKKHEMVMIHHINQQEIRKALSKLSQIDLLGRENLMYKFAPVFMKYEPKKSVDSLIELAKQRKGLIEVKKLIPALMNADHNSRVEAIRFEQYLILSLKLKEKALHNLYLFHLSEIEGEGKIIEYLKIQETQGELYFDAEYALTVFKQNGKVESQICLYSLLKMHSEAVTLAIDYRKFDLAKANAKKPEKSDEELSRKLWLQIAIHHIKQNNVRDALTVMNESKLIKMEDLLPYFDEQDSISNFKEDICKALAGYKKTINELNEELKESRTSAHQVSEDLDGVKERYFELEGMQMCETCFKPALNRSFYVYPCSHVFHKDCLINMLISVFSVKDTIKANKILYVIDQIELKENNDNRKVRKGEECKETLQDLYEKLDGLISNQCYLCSYQFIESIRDNMIEDEQEQKLWGTEYKLDN